MFGFSKKTDTATEEASTEKKGFLERLKPRLKQGLHRTRTHLTQGLTQLVSGKKTLDEALLEDIETLLLTADIGVETSQFLLKDLTEQVSRQQLTEVETLFQTLHQNMQVILQPVAQPLIIPPTLDKPFVILVVGVNGAGKTTTIGKLAQRLLTEGRSVMLAAGDTYRAAAVEQLEAWGTQNGVPVIAQQGRADSAAVIHDALQSATARGIEVLIADTAGRLHTQDNLMAELQKVRRVIKKLDPEAPHETLLVIDAVTGQNALVQAKQFQASVAVTGLTLTKLDGTAKGGIIFTIAQQLGLPIRFIGIGEGAEDLRVFEATPFIDALLSREA